MNSRTSRFKYVIALDFEATCEAEQLKIPHRKTEIIEFPAVLMDVTTGQIISEFQRYCRPVEKPILSQYCLNLTKIKQSQVDQANELSHVLDEFHAWLLKAIKQYNLIVPKISTNDRSNINCAFITWTNFDINFFLASECERKGIPLPNYFHEWINLKGIFRGRYGIQDSKGCTFETALKLMKMDFQGTQHSGLDDSRNLAMLAYKMLQNGVYFKWNGILHEEKGF